VRLLDTNHCSRILESDPDVLRKARESGETRLATSVIVRGELIFMAQHSERREINLARVLRLLEDLRVYPVDEATADLYGDLKARIFRRFGPRERGKRRRARIEHLGISENDLWIAATALRHGLTVVSADGDFKRIREVAEFSLEQWWNPAPEGTA